MQPPSILQTTTNILRLYKHMVGKSQVPLAFHLWSAISLIGACVSDRVYYEKEKGKKLAPNTYVFLIGSPATGKGTAIKKAVGIYRDAGGGNLYDPREGLLYGSTTKWDFEDYLSKSYKVDGGEEYGPFPKVWLLTEELSNNIGDGRMANAFFKLMTSLYTDVGEEVYLGTRNNGRHWVKEPCVNWLMGTNEGDLVNSLDKNAAGSGFFSRVAPIMAEYDDSKRYRRPIIPWDHDMVRQHIVARLFMLRQIEGRFAMSSGAQRKEELWYMNRSMPEDVDEVPNWMREQDLVLKLAMILCLCEGGPLVIQEGHFVEAVKMSMSVQKSVPKMIELSHRGPDLEARKTLVEFLMRRLEKMQLGKVKSKKMDRSELGDKMRKAGMPTRVFNKLILELIGDGKAGYEILKNGKTLYWWKGRKGV